MAAHTARRGQIDAELGTLAGMGVEEADVAATLREFGPLWDSLLPRERRRVVELVVVRAVAPSDGGPVALTLHDTGLHASREVAASPA